MSFACVFRFRPRNSETAENMPRREVPPSLEAARNGPDCLACLDLALCSSISVQADMKAPKPCTCGRVLLVAMGAPLLTLILGAVALALDFLVYQPQGKGPLMSYASLTRPCMRPLQCAVGCRRLPHTAGTP